MAARTKSRVTPKYKTKYRVRNWAAYDTSLRQRGDITVWFDEDAVAAWNAPSCGRPGGQCRYSDLAIVTALTLRAVFHLPLRQTEGFLASLIGLLGLSLQTPDHTTLSRRSRTVEVPRVAKAQDGAIHLVIDSTGLKIVGSGEWHAHKHRRSNRRRRWRKLHLAIDGEGFIVASRLTGSSTDDAATGVEMLKGLGVALERFTADGAYDTRAMYEAVGAIGAPSVKIVIPPKRTAVADPLAVGPWRQRNETQEWIARVGRRQWRKESGAFRSSAARVYGRRSATAAATLLRCTQMDSVSTVHSLNLTSNTSE